MLNIDPYTEEQWWAMCDANMGLPLPLNEADLSKPFVYERAHGVFYVPRGSHQHAMSVLLAFQHDLHKGVDVAKKLSLVFSSGTADHWLQNTPGAAFRSSVGKRVLVGKRGSLTVMERRRLGDVEYLF